MSLNYRSESGALILFTLWITLGCSTLATVMASSQVVSTDTTKHRDLASFLKEVSGFSEELKSIDLQLQALRAEIRSRDLELQSVLTGELRQLWDDRAALSATSRSTQREAGFAVTKELPTGTALSVSGSYDFSRERQSSENPLHNMEWRGEIEQALWRNAFGRALRLRRAADSSELESRVSHLHYLRAIKLLAFEHWYWDFLLAEHEIVAFKTNLEKSRKSEAWVQRRLARSAAERTDVLQAQSLVARRELELQEALDRKESLRRQLLSWIPQSDWISSWTPHSEVAFSERLPETLVLVLSVGSSLGSSQASAIPLRADAQAEAHLAHSLHLRAQKVGDEYRPDLNVFAAAGSNALDSRASRTMSNSFNHRFAEVGLRFTLDLRFALKFDAVEAARLRALASQQNALALMRQSESEWINLKETLERQTKRLEIARELARLQRLKSEEERRRYEQGRSTAFQAISFEQEAIEADLFEYRLRIAQRKEEARAQLFVWPEKMPLP